MKTIFRKLLDLISVIIGVLFLLATYASIAIGAVVGLVIAVGPCLFVFNIAAAVWFHFFPGTDQPIARHETITLAKPAVSPLSPSVSADPKVLTVPQIVQDAKPAIAQVMASNQNGVLMCQGTGFFVGHSLFTAFHVIAGAIHITIKTAWGDTIVNPPWRYWSFDPDIVILDCTGKAGVPSSGLRCDHLTSVTEGQRVLVIGNPEGLYGTVSEGIISAFRGPDRELIQITAPVSPGSSGSPVLDESGRVIGVITSSSEKGQNLNFAISCDAIDKMVHLHKEPKAFPRDSSPANPAELRIATILSMLITRSY